MNSLSTDNTPDFLVDIPKGWGDYRDAVAGDHLVISYQPQAGGAIVVYLDYTLTSGDITSDTIAATGASPVANGIFNFWINMVRGALTSANSANVSVTVAVGNNRISSAGNRRISSVGNYRIAAA